MLSMIHDPGRQNGKTTACFAVCTIHFHSFSGYLLEWCQDKIEESPQDICVGVPLGFVGMG